MIHVTYNSKDYILWRLPSYNDLTKAELVDSQTGEVIRVEVSEIQASSQHQRSLAIEPNAIPFPDRPRTFVDELQSRRVQLLREAQAARRTDKGPRQPKTRASGPRAKKPSKFSQLSKQLFDQRLAELSSSGGMSPQQLAVLKKLASE